MKKESCGNDGTVESVEIQRQDFPSSHRSLEISQRTRDSHIRTAPAAQLLWESGKTKKQVSHFPTAIYLGLNKQKRPTASAKKRGHFYRGKDGDISNEA